MEIVAADIGGTHARFALAIVEAGHVVKLADPLILKTADFTSLETAWQAFGARLGRKLPRDAAIAIASPVGPEIIKLTNNPWRIDRTELNQRLGLERHDLINDFGAIGHSVAALPDKVFDHLAGPDGPVPPAGVITVCGPGTGLGVAQIVRRPGSYQVIETEGGHIDFAPLDPFEDRLLHRLRLRHHRVSAERIVSGPGIASIYEQLALDEHRTMEPPDHQAIWAAAFDGSDSIAVAALDRFCRCLGALAGDLALAQGAASVVIAGGLGLRLREHLSRSGFAERFAAKGRFKSMMEAIPVKLITYPEPGLFGAAAAFAQRFSR